MLFNLAVFAALAAAVSADKSCLFSATTVTASTALSLLASCPTLDGHVTVSGTQLGSVDLSSIKEIKGDLKVFNLSSITDISFNQLQTISGSLEIDACTQLHVIDLSLLTEAEQLSLISLPSLATINLNKGLSKAGSIEISDTALSSLQGLTNYNTVGTLNINNNKNISSVDLPLQTVTDTLTLSFNADECEVKLDQLEWASNLTVQDVLDLSASNLTAVNGTFVLAYNRFDSAKLPELEKVGGSLQIFANDDLRELSIDKLTDVGGELRLFNNSQLEELSFEDLETIKGAVNIDGAFGNFTLPNLSEVDGDFSVVSTSENFSCSDFNKLHSKKKIEGHNFNCSAPSATQSLAGAKSSSDSKGSSSGSDSSSDSKSSGSSSSGSSSSSKKSDGTNLMANAFLATSFVGALVALLI